jgi:DNA polymerase (family 10)
MGLTLNEYALATLKGEKRVAGRTEEEIYSKLKLDFIPPELRENTGEIAAAENHKLPHLLSLKDVKGDLQMHSTASDGKNSIEEMAEAARELGHQYIAITDHSKAVTVANGLDERRMAAHIKKIHAANDKDLHIRVLAGAEVDILKDGSLDYSDEILAQLDVVVCSIHSYFNLDRAAMTERMLAAIENPYTQIIAHPTGRLLLRRDPLDYDMEKVLEACARHGVAMECNSYPDRLDLKDVYLRMCKERGVKVVISTDSHNTGNLSFIRHGVTMARRGWLEKKDVINTLPTEQFLEKLRPKPGSAGKKHAAKDSPNAEGSRLLDRPAQERLTVRGGLDGCLQRFRHFAGDVVLNHQDIVEWAVVGFRPDNVAVVRANQPRGDPQPSAGLAHAPIEHISDTQRLGDIGDGHLRSPMRTRP